MLMQNLGGQTKSIMVFSKVTYYTKTIIQLGLFEYWWKKPRLRLDFYSDIHLAFEE